MMKLVEERTGIGELILDGVALCEAPYSIRRFQGMTESSGMPIPGLHRIEGSVEFRDGNQFSEWIGIPLGLKLEDGRVLGITLINNEGRILSEGHGPSKCFCC